MASQLTEEIRNLSDDQLEDYIDTFKNRVETTQDYLSDCDSYDIRAVMQGNLQEYSSKLRLLLDEKKRRSDERINTEFPNGHPARPAGVKLTREMQIKTFQAYFKCPDYMEKIPTVNNPVYRREIAENPFARNSILCKEDCLFPTCPFYDSWSIMNRCKFHQNDYDEWVVKGYEERFK